MAQPSHEEFWRRALTEQGNNFRAEWFVLKLMPGGKRCGTCHAPTDGASGTVLRHVLGVRPSNYNPSFCNICDSLSDVPPGGAEIELAVLFADVRGSTRLAQQMSPTEFSQLMDRFYTAATQVVVSTGGLIEKFVGDEVTCLYVPGYAGKDFAAKAVEAARAMLTATGHDDPEEPWLPVGIGVHMGVGFVGSVGSGGVSQLTVLGDLPNTGARLASAAGAGEILVSDAAMAASGVCCAELEHRELVLKGRSQPQGAYVIRAGTAQGVSG